MANELYRMYNEVIEGHKTKNEMLFEHGVRCWMDLNPENPFEGNVEASDAFFRIKNAYTVWRMNGADYRVSRRRMLEAAHELCELYPKRPYKFDKEAEKEYKAQKAAEAAELERISKEHEEQLIQREAERIVQEEIEKKELEKKREQARLEWEKAEAEERAREKRVNDAIQKAVEEKRAEAEKTEQTKKVIKQEPEILFGVLPEEEPEKKISFFKRLFGKKG